MKFPLRLHAARKHARGALGCALALSIGLGTLVLVAPTESGFSAAVNNSGNALGTGTAFATVKDSGGSTLCSSVPASSTVPDTATFTCSGTPLAAQVPASATSTTTTLTQSGTQGFGGAKAWAGTCYPVGFANATSGTNPQLLRYGVSGGQAGPTQLANSASATFNGVNGSTTEVASGGNPQTFTVAAWFKTSSKQGAVVGFTNTANPSGESAYDRILYVDNLGEVVWDTVPGGGAGNISEVTSGTNYADGAWHFAVGIGQAAAGASSISLYVDNQFIGTKSISQSISAESYTGYWHVGYTSLGSRPRPGSAYFAGNISNVTVFPSALSGDQVASLWNAGSQSAYGSTVSGLGASDLWALGDASTYTGALTGGAAGPCAHSTFYVNGAATSALSASASADIPALGVGATQNVQLGLATNSGYSAYDAGAHIDLSVGLREYAFPQTFSWTHLGATLR